MAYPPVTFELSINDDDSDSTMIFGRMFMRNRGVEASVPITMIGRSITWERLLRERQKSISLLRKVYYSLNH